MRVAVAGPGDVGRYFVEELVRAGHEVVILTRSPKPHLNCPEISQFVTDYSLESVSQAIDEYDVLISTIMDYSMRFAHIHLTLIQACKQSTKCKRFIPSEYSGDVAKYPQQPSFYYANHEPVRKALRDQKEIEWTLVCVGWLMDYLIPQKNRYIKDIGEAFPVDITSQSAIIPGSGEEPVDLTAARDLAKAITALVSTPEWEPYTYVSGERTAWLDVVKVMHRRQPGLSVTFKSLDQLNHIIRTGDDEARLLAEYQLFLSPMLAHWTRRRSQAREKSISEACTSALFARSCRRSLKTHKLSSSLVDQVTFKLQQLPYDITVF